MSEELWKLHIKIMFKSICSLWNKKVWIINYFPQDSLNERYQEIDGKF